jgi:hypothetical protein
MKAERRLDVASMELLARLALLAIIPVGLALSLATAPTSGLRAHERIVAACDTLMMPPARPPIIDWFGKPSPPPGEVAREAEALRERLRVPTWVCRPAEIR